MADGDFGERDLLGGRPFAPREGRGRPEHQATIAKLNKVLMAFVAGYTLKQAADSIGVSVPTLRKHYFSAVDVRDKAALIFEVERLVRLNEKAAAGNVSAEKELGRLLERAKIAQVSDQVSGSVRPPKPLKQGKKAALQQAADEMVGLYDTPPQPGQMH
ncbi:hypothetical protein [Sphingomonas sp. Leaf4]|uniref:hypothetical protein n=1 Tax=Sphingomonas sp. Leaf4 TaxID=2876553 RepID=UPI001E5ADF57|nr:hypothetical protein [Sphingomonas sp. Leaf4]